MTHRVWLVVTGVWSLCTLLLLGGCAAQKGVSGASGEGPLPPEIVTASDEPEGRRRARIRLELATGYFDQGQTTVALDELKQSLAADPTFADAFNLRGLIYMRLSEPRLAEDSFRRAAALNPRDPNVAHNYGWLLCQQARYTEAEPQFVTALGSPVYGGQAKTWMARGLCQMNAARPEEAERSLSRAYELDPANPVVAYNLANLLYKRGNDERARFYLRRLNNSELANAETLWLGIRVERRLGNRDTAQQLANQLTRRFPQSPEVAALERGAFNE